VTAIWLGVASLLLVAIYPFMKRITWWPQAWLGLTFNWGALMGFAAALPLAKAVWLERMEPLLARPGVEAYVVSGYMDFYAAVFLYLGGVFWTLGYDTIYALQDIEDDAMVGVKSSARRLGGRVKVGVAVFYALAVLMAALAGSQAGLGPIFAVGVLAYAGHLAWQVWRLNADDPALALALFKSNREAGLILLAAIVLGGLSWS
jgi:4-hydroxybenzoate polyprenyltransferase